MSQFKTNMGQFGLFFLRLFVGCTMLAAHGMPKILGFAEKHLVFADPLHLGSSLSLGLAIAAEVGCSVLLILGFATRLVSLPLAFTMLVAAVMVHGADPFAKKELALVYAVIYLTLFFTGGGSFSLGKKSQFFQRWS